jgi:hypothetical protein
MAPSPQRPSLVHHPSTTLLCRDPIFCTIIPVGCTTRVDAPGSEARSVVDWSCYDRRHQGQVSQRSRGYAAAEDAVFFGWATGRSLHGRPPEGWLVGERSRRLTFRPLTSSLVARTPMETPKECALRELQEELGFHPKHLFSIGCVDVSAMLRVRTCSFLLC